MRNNGVKFVLALLATMLLSSCGYHFSGTGAIVPEGMKTLAVPVFFNATNEPYVDVEVTQAVVEEFMTDGRLRIVSVEEADLALRGRITRYEVIPLSYTPQSFVQQYRVRIIVAASLEDIRSKKILWKEQGIESNFISDYAVKYGDNMIRDTRTEKDAAIKKASQDIAWTLRSRVLEGF
jgi:outer membrane lipopolysaccharide assembly protein LptE/RlpB